VNALLEIMIPERLQRQIEFIIEIDKLKSVLRRSYLINGARKENTAEHSWHLLVIALVLAEHANDEVDLLKVMKLLVVHDIVEIDAGDTFVYDSVGALTKSDRETAAAERIFGLLPADQSAEVRALWDEFEAGDSPEGRWARALDRLMPLLHNYHTQGRSWREHGIRSEQVLARNAQISQGSEALWVYAQTIIADAVSKGYFDRDAKP
jgi:putative hydrolase of HD superfamily